MTAAPYRTPARPATPPPAAPSLPRPNVEPRWFWQRCARTDHRFVVVVLTPDEPVPKLDWRFPLRGCVAHCQRCKTTWYALPRGTPEVVRETLANLARLAWLIRAAEAVRDSFAIMADLARDEVAAYDRALAILSQPGKL